MSETKTYDVIFLPTQAQALNWRKCAANKRLDVSFATRITTFGIWVANLWGLFGNSSAIVNATQRDVLLRKAAFSLGYSNTKTKELVSVAKSALSTASGLQAFEQAVKAAGNLLMQNTASNLNDASGTLLGFCAAEVDVLKVVSKYYELLKNYHLIELGQALAYLPPHLPQPKVSVLFEGCAPLTNIQVAFFNACKQFSVSVHAHRGAGGVVPPPSGTEVQFAFPAGEMAFPRLVYNTICETVKPNSQRSKFGAVVTCKHPHALYKRISGKLSSSGFNVAVRSNMPFLQTSFGRAFASLAQFCNTYTPPQISKVTDTSIETTEYSQFKSVQVECWNKTALVDFLLTPFSGVSTNFAQAFDAEIQSDRLVQKKGATHKLCKKSKLFANMLNVVQAADKKSLLNVRRCVYAMKGKQQAWRDVQLAAIDALLGIVEMCLMYGENPANHFEVLENIVVNVSHVCYANKQNTFANQAKGKVQLQEVLPESIVQNPNVVPDVLITNQSTAATLGHKSACVLIAGDLTNEAYPALDVEDASITMLEKLSIARTDTALAQMRRTFFELENVPQKRLVLSRPLNNKDAQPTYQCAVLEEFINCYRECITSISDIDNAYALPENLQENMVCAGENDLWLNRSFEAPNLKPVECAKEPSHVSAGNKNKIVLPRVVGGGKVVSDACLSPSQIESYLECPYKWFVSRRVRTEGIEEGFGPVHMGDFSHNVLESFYRHFRQDLGFKKVNERNLREAKHLMADVLARHAAMQPYIHSGSSNRLIPNNVLEQLEIEQLKTTLLNYLDFEARLLPNFHPEFLEYSPSEEAPVNFAGHKLIGTADRIDIDNHGNFVVIDYKGSLSGEYNLSAQTETYLGKVQSLIYAQVARRALNLTPQAALYVSYSKHNATCGVYDACTIDAVHLPNMNYQACSWVPSNNDGMSFTEFLDTVEQVIAQKLENMLAGDIAPCPATAAACKYCPVQSCKMRMC